MRLPFQAEREELMKVRAYAESANARILLAESARLLETLTALAKPKSILEIGTSFGYSGLLMLLTAPEATLNTIEISEPEMLKAREFFHKYGVSDRVYTHLGDAKLIVPMFSGEFDLIFMDGPKSSYIEFLPYLLRLLPSGGTLVCDNVLYKGWVYGDNEPPKKKHNTIIKNLNAFCSEISNNPMLTTAFIPIGDGISVSVKR